jgi:small subunit ribosomal protein S4
MSRYTGPRLKIVRALGAELPGLTTRTRDKRDYPPGQHGLKNRRVSDFGKKLIEKQKLRYNYGLRERQFRLLFAQAKRSTTPTGAKLLELLERRLDNVVFRAGYAPTIVAARQLVRHGHIALNGRRVDIPSVSVKPGDEIAVRDKASGIPMIVESIAAPALARPEWLAFEESTKKARMTRTPSPDEVPFPVEVQQVVEYYATRM